MPIIKTLNKITPSIHETAFIAENAVIIGEVNIAAEASIWYSTVLRGDVGAIQIGARSNIQDLSMIHTTYNYSQTVVGEDVTVGHSVTLHGCTIEDRCLIGMGSVIMDKAVVQKQVIVAAGTVVLEKMVLESGHLYAGTPAKKIKPLSQNQLNGLKTRADQYLMYKQWYEK